METMTADQHAVAAMFVVAAFWIWLPPIESAET